MSITINLEKEQEDCLEQLAKDKNIDVNQFITKIIDDYFESLLDDELLKIAEERSADIKAGKSKIFSFEEVLKENGLSD